MAEDTKKKDERKKDEEHKRNEGEKGGKSEYRPEEDKGGMNQDLDYSDIDEV